MLVAAASEEEAVEYVKSSKDTADERRLMLPLSDVVPNPLLMPPVAAALARVLTELVLSDPPA